MGRWAALAALTLVYSLTWIVARVLRLRPSRRGRSGVLAAVGSFHNPNWFRAHATPLARSGPREVIFVVDEAHAPLPGIRFVVPAAWSRRLTGRALSKLFALWRVGLRDDPEVIIGYHIFPGAITALLVARLLGRPACHQMTAGPIEVEGGGYRTENRVLTRLKRPSPWIERLALAVTREMDVVVVRGERASREMSEHGLVQRVRIVPGSIDPARFPAHQPRDIDLVFVGRLAEIKRPDRFVQVVARVASEAPTVRAVVVGHGPMRPELEALAADLGVRERIEWLGQRDDVETIISRAKVYVLTSRSEGLSIALAEAMSAGAVPVVADVGELGDLVQNAITGFLIDQDDIEAYAARVLEVLRDDALFQRLSQAGAAAARRYNDVDAVADRWRRIWDELAARPEAPSGARRRESAEAAPLSGEGRSA